MVGLLVDPRVPTSRPQMGQIQCATMATLINETEERVDSCEHLVQAEEQIRNLLCIINDHLKLYEPDDDAFGSLLSVAHHLSEGMRELSYLLDQAEESSVQGLPKEIGH